MAPRPDCFGNLDRVFPQTDSGLRTTPEACSGCKHKTDCLRSAMNGADGFLVRQEAVDRAYAAGRIGFWQRWSKRKLLNRQSPKNRTGPNR